MSSKSNCFQLKTSAMAVLGLCLIIGQTTMAADFGNFPSVKSGQKVQGKQNLQQQLSNAKLLIDMKKYDLKKATDLKSLEMNFIKVKEQMGPGSGSGGDSCALMILANTKALLTAMYSQNVFGDNTEIPKALENAIANTKIFYSPELTVDGKTVEAINYPADKTLAVSERFCQRIKEVSIASIGVLQHEYLALAGIEDRGYEISIPFVTQLKNLEYSPRTIDGEERLDFMTGNLLEVQQDMLFPANYGGQTFADRRGKEFFRVIVSLNNRHSVDRILPTATQMKILNAEIAGGNYYRKDAECHAYFRMIVDHSEIEVINFLRVVPVTSREECSSIITNPRVKDFYRIVGRYFLIKAKPPRVMK